MVSGNSGSLIERRREQAAGADRAILAALADAAPESLTVPDLARLALGNEGRQDSREGRTRRRLAVLTVAGQVRAEGRRYYAVGVGSVPVVDPRDQVIADQRVAWLAAAEQAGYLGRIGDLLRDLDGRAIPPGQGDRAAAARSILRSLQQAVSKCDQEMFIRIRDEWAAAMQTIEVFAQQCVRDREESHRTQVADRAWVDAHRVTIDAQMRDVRAHIKRLRDDLEEILDCIDEAPAQTHFMYRMPISSDFIEWALHEGYIVQTGNQKNFVFSSGITGVNYQVTATTSLAVREPKLNWSQFLEFMDFAADAFESAIAECDRQLAALAAERHRDPAVARGIGGAPRQLLAIEQ